MTSRVGLSGQCWSSSGAKPSVRTVGASSSFHASCPPVPENTTADKCQNITFKNGLSKSCGLFNQLTFRSRENSQKGKKVERGKVEKKARVKVKRNQGSSVTSNFFLFQKKTLINVMGLSFFTFKEKTGRGYLYLQNTQLGFLRVQQGVVSQNPPVNGYSSLQCLHEGYYANIQMLKERLSKEFV